jgi:hypothetical protein
MTWSRWLTKCATRIKSWIRRIWNTQNTQCPTASRKEQIQKVNIRSKFAVAMMKGFRTVHCFVCPSICRAKSRGNEPQ